MRQLKIFSGILFSCVLINSCTNFGEKEKLLHNSHLPNKYSDKEKKAMNYLKEKKLEPLFDTARWYLYNTYCDVKADYLLRNDSFYIKMTTGKKDIYLGTLELKLIEAHIDTATNNLFMGVYFFINDSTFLLGNLGQGNGSVPDGIIMNLMDTTFLNFTSGILNFRKSRIDANENLAPSLKNFIDSNSNLLHPSYLNLLKKQKVIQ